MHDPRFGNHYLVEGRWDLRILGRREARLEQLAEIGQRSGEIIGINRRVTQQLDIFVQNLAESPPYLLGLASEV